MGDIGTGGHSPADLGDSCLPISGELSWFITFIIDAFPPLPIYLKSNFPGLYL